MQSYNRPSFISHHIWIMVFSFWMRDKDVIRTADKKNIWKDHAWMAPRREIVAWRAKTRRTEQG